MKVRIRDELDLNQRINTRRLPPIMKIYAGIVSKWRESATYKRGLNKKIEEANLATMRADEELKQILLAQIHRELNTNTELGREGKTCSSMILSVDANKKKSLARVLKHKDFLPYNISIVPENKDIRTAFKAMPYLVKVSKKVV